MPWTQYNSTSILGFLQLKKFLFDRQFIKKIEEISQIKNLQVIDDRFGQGLHQGGDDSFLDIHIDYNLHPVKKKQRRLNLLIFLNERWPTEWGGNARVLECKCH